MYTTLLNLIQPYITKYYLGLTNPPVNMAKIAIGDGTIGSGEVFEELPTVSTFYLHFDNFLTCCFFEVDHD